MLGRVCLATDPDFTIVALPDTQFYSQSYPDTFNAQTQWIVDHSTSNNIVFVTHLGDIVNSANITNQWNKADTAMDILDSAGVPYGLCVGNHDQYPMGDPAGTANFDSYFSYQRYSGETWYGGHYGSDNDNSYQLFSVGSLDFIIIHLEYDVNANSSVLDWADGLLQSYSQRRAIISSHALFDRDLADTFSDQGQATYDALKDNPNLFLMVCGHSDHAEEGRRTDVYNGNTIYTLLSDYQDRTNGGDGWLRLMEFSPDGNQINVKTYSPTLNQYETDASSQFTLSYAMSSIPPSITQHPSSQTIATGQTATLNVVASGTLPYSYQWQRNQSNLADGGNISGATTAAMQIANCQSGDQANYRCLVTNAYGTATSNTAALTVAACGNPGITNGNFEASTAATPPTSWTTYIQATKSGNWTIQTAIPPQGTQWQQTQVYNASSYGGIYRNVTGLINGAVYTIAGTYKVNSVSATASVRYNLTGNTDRANSTALVSTISTNWSTFSGTVTASGGTISLFLDQLNGTSSNKAAGFDNITMVVVSCPDAPPTITQHPAAQNVCTGANATFSVAATGDGTLTYQWQKNTVNISNGGHYSGCTTATVSVAGADTNDAADYRCVVANASGSVTSNAAALILKSVSSITGQPSNQTIPSGGTATFSVTATGDGTLTYQWQKNAANLTDGGHYSGVTTATMSVSSADTNDAASYRCVATAGCGSATSNAATLTVTTCSTPAITNGNFETSTAANPPSGWTTYIQSTKSGNWTIQTATPPQGTRWQQTQVYNASSWGGIRQNVTGLVAGTIYTVSGSYKTNSTSATASVRYNLSGDTNRTNSTALVATASTNWGTFSANVTASGTSLMLFLDQLNGTSTNKAGGFDNIKVICAP